MSAFGTKTDVTAHRNEAYHLAGRSRSGIGNVPSQREMFAFDSFCAHLDLRRISSQSQKTFRQSFISTGAGAFFFGATGAAVSSEGSLSGGTDEVVSSDVSLSGGIGELVGSDGSLFDGTDEVVRSEGSLFGGIGELVGSDGSLFDGTDEAVRSEGSLFGGMGAAVGFDGSVFGVTGTDVRSVGRGRGKGTTATFRPCSVRGIPMRSGTHTATKNIQVICGHCAEPLDVGFAPKSLLNVPRMPAKCQKPTLSDSSASRSRLSQATDCQRADRRQYR